MDQQAPDVVSPNLPLNLPTIVHDLDSTREALRPGGGRLPLCSFARLASEGLVLSPVAQGRKYRNRHEHYDCRGSLQL